MNAERWDELQAAFHDALESAGAHRQEVLERLEPRLRAEVRSLLQSHDESVAMLDGWAEHRTPERIGPYRVVRQVGKGGSGLVYEATRADGEFEQRVAIKILRDPARDLLGIERIRQERQILGNLSHPSITRLLDGGTLPEGRPYIVMEYVEGRPLLEYAAELPTAGKLRLFLTICDAVQYAHRSLVIHRDLKPQNILVSHEGVPKLLDFGIAKLMGPEDASLTVPGFNPMTVAYAAPEQLGGGPSTTAVDVYGLGLVLFELLTGRSAYSGSPDTAGGWVRMVCEEPPLPLRAAGFADERYRADLEAVIEKALAKRPEDRYSEVSHFADDVQRCLDGVPVRARSYRTMGDLWRWTRRHRVAVGASSAILLSLTAGLGLALRAEHAAVAERERAERALTEGRRLASFLLYDSHDAVKNQPDGLQLTRLMLERAAGFVTGMEGLADTRPELAKEVVDLYGRIGALYGETFDVNLGDFDLAIRYATKARDLAARYSRLFPEVTSLREASSGLWILLGDVYVGGKRYPEALDCYERAKASAGDLDEEHRFAIRTVVDSMRGDLLLKMDRVDEALAIQKRVLSERLAFAQSHPNFQEHPTVTIRDYIGNAYFSLGEALARKGRRTEALSALHEAARTRELRAKQFTFPGVHRRLAQAWERIGDVELAGGNRPAAKSWYDKSHEVWRRLVEMNSGSKADHMGLAGVEAKLRER